MTFMNDARALHDLLESIAASGTSAPHQAWAGALDAEWGSVEFARRHAEVVGLYTGTLQQVASLSDSSRERFERYAWSWWEAVIAPLKPWSTRVDMTSVVETNGLDQLGSVADVIEARMVRSMAAPGRSNLTDLRDMSQDWIDAVLEETELAAPLRLNLLQDLRHIVWLIENANMFGVARVAAAGEKVVGNVIVASDTLPPAKHGVWLERGKKFVGALVMLGGLHAGVETGYELTQYSTSFMAELMAGGEESSPPAPESVDDTQGTEGAGEA